MIDRLILLITQWQERRFKRWLRRNRVIYPPRVNW